MLPDAVLPEATAVLIYDQPDAQQSPETVQQTLAELTAVAEAVDSCLARGASCYVPYRPSAR